MIPNDFLLLTHKKANAMRHYIDKERIDTIKHHLIKQYKAVYHYVKTRYQSLNRTLNRKQRIGFVLSVGLILLTLVIFSVSHHAHKVLPKSTYPIHFEHKTDSVDKLNNKLTLSDMNQERTVKWQSQLNQLEAATNQQYRLLKTQLQTIRSNMDSLASQRDVLQLQQTMGKPNKALLNKVVSLQQSVQKIVQQTAKKVWINPRSVERYFRLVAIQGFSDGMRAIIDVDGHQTALSRREICPACRGWVLQRLDFANQSAVFSKHTSKHSLYVKLQAN